MNNQELLELAKLAQANFHNRRTMEWHLLFGYWGSLGLIVFAFLSGNVTIGATPLLITRFAFVGLLFVMVFLCILPIQRSHAFDQRLFLYYTRRIEGIETEADRPVEATVCLNRAWTAGQVLFSTILTVIAIILISNVSKDSHADNKAGAQPSAGTPSPKAP